MNINEIKKHNSSLCKMMFLSGLVIVLSLGAIFLNYLNYLMLSDVAVLFFIMLPLFNFVIFVISFVEYLINDLTIKDSIHNEMLNKVLKKKKKKKKDRNIKVTINKATN